MAELDYAQLDATLAKGGPDDFARASEQLGVDLDAPAYARIREWCEQTYENRVRPALVFAVIRRALGAPEGIGWERYERPSRFTHVLVVKWEEAGAARVTLGVRKDYGSKKLSSVWPELEGWKPRLEANRARAEAWAKQPELKDRLTLAVRPDVRLPTSGGDDEKKLLAAIAERPDDETLRLVYADWLSERGDARAELIRLQLAEARDPYGDHERRKKLDAMLESSWTNFAGELAPWASKGSFDRGLVSRVTMTVAAFVKEGERLFSTYPLQTLQLDNRRFTAKQLAQLANTPALDRVRELTVCQVNPNATPRLPLVALTEGTHYRSLRKLHFWCCGHSGKDWSDLFMRLEAPALEALEFSFNHTHPALWRALGTSPHLTQLKSIDEYVFSTLPGGGGELDEALKGFAENRPKLETLVLSQVDHLSDVSLEPLFAKSSCVALRTLDINGATLSDATLKLWSRSPRLGALESLTVRNAGFTADGVCAFLDSGNTPKLKLLSLIAHDQLLWTHEALGQVYEALLRVPKSAPLKRVELPHGRRASDPLWQKLKARYEIRE